MIFNAPSSGYFFILDGCPFQCGASMEWQCFPMFIDDAYQEGKLLNAPIDETLKALASLDIRKRVVELLHKYLLADDLGADRYRQYGILHVSLLKKVSSE